MSALLHDPCCVFGLLGVSAHVIGWASLTSGRKLRRWWVGRADRRLMSQVPE